MTLIHPKRQTYDDHLVVGYFRGNYEATSNLISTHASGCEGRDNVESAPEPWCDAV